MSTPAIPVSTVPKAIAAILAATEAQIAAAGQTGSVILCIGDPSRATGPQIIAISDAVRRRSAPHTIVGSGGPLWLQEQYTVDVVVSVAGQTTDLTATTLALLDKAYLCMAYVETGVRSDPSLGGVVNVAYPNAAAGGKPKWSENNVGRICELTIPIHCSALI